METATAATLMPSGPQTAPAEVINKAIVWDTNFNNKLFCQAFVHIDFAPRQVPKRVDLERTLVEIRTTDNSHPPVTCKIFDLMFVKAWEAATAFGFCSHGLTYQRFIDWFTERHNIEYNPNMEVCVYFYQRV